MHTCLSDFISNALPTMYVMLSQIIEEGPITIAPMETVKELEEAARRLAKCVNYVGAATMEYLYSMETGEYILWNLIQDYRFLKF